VLKLWFLAILQRVKRATARARARAPIGVCGAALQRLRYLHEYVSLFPTRSGDHSRPLARLCRGVFFV
jgi:hypothetical protein